MAGSIVIQPMTKDFVVWRCLHGGPLSAETINQWDPDTTMPWEQLRSRNVPLLEKLIDTYGTCMILARDGDLVVGMLYFAPKAVFDMDGAGFLCLQQNAPAGPADDFVENAFPAPDDIDDRTLTVQCIMTGSPKVKENRYQRKGIGTRMARALIEWAKERAWRHIEASSFEDIPLLYENTGNAGRGFWEKLGFRVVHAEPNPAFQKRGEFVVKLEQQAASLGIDPEQAKQDLTMRLDLG